VVKSRQLLAQELAELFRGSSNCASSSHPPALDSSEMQDLSPESSSDSDSDPGLPADHEAQGAQREERKAELHRLQSEKRTD
jgi:hypothetical protein